MSKIKCQVEECHYYDDRICSASEINVRSSNDSKNVKKSCDTECQTFKPRDIGSMS